MARSAPMGTVIRLARLDEGAALARIACVPMELGDVVVTVDRGHDFFAPFRLAADSTIVVAEVDGAPVGVYSAALHLALAGGRRSRMLALHQCRLAPEHQRGGLFWPMTEMLMGSYEGRYDTPHTYIHPDNAAARRLTVVDAWSIRVLRAVLPCAALAGPPAGRAATPQDADRIVDALNALHANEEMYLPCTPELLAARLGRAPDLYAWDDFVVGERAVVGMWSIGERRSCRPSGAGAEHAGADADVSVRAWVLDYGCAPGAEAELGRLIRDRCRVAAEVGMTHLTVFTSERSASLEVLKPLAEDFEPYDFRTAALPEPAGARRHGIHVDPVYF